MKLFFISAILGFSSLAAASAKCPADMQTIRECVSTPAPGDAEFAIGFFDSVAICSKDNKAFMVGEAKGSSETAPVKFSGRAGGASYSIRANDVDFVFSYATGLPPRAPKKAQLAVTFLKAKPPVTGTSTFSCK